ncbi:MAG: hypothetical protein R3B84_15985 [Zavarzinella sp.]
MLRANVGLSRKISRDFNSSGYSVSLDGEIPVFVHEPEVIIEKILELFSLAEEALAQEIELDRRNDSLGRLNENRPISNHEISGNENPCLPRNGTHEKSQGDQAQASNIGNKELATDKQVQFLLAIGKRFKLTTLQLESRVAKIIGRKCGLNDLTKAEAGLVLDRLKKETQGNNTPNGHH